ncbi:MULTISPECIES: serine/threonine protein kinase [Cyanophyceae]|uniref:serine/threonine protein kinase n=3 Tax=Cyanobacteriota TaxID=1117 RepID=UPI00232AFA7E|nr:MULTISPECIES: serine/threonine protein kinase [Cyanophyceae]MDB9306388.1 protein kinase [Nodularia spumigena CS-591/12]MDB9369834.1 protein kinase [Nodularia spumigena CS-586/05]MDB9398594.1 protein kinase [Microcystis aeruginosa CS-567/02-A1]MDB9498919.1 protein kinase [Nodularia spumigena CS-336/02]MDB9533182.1 protein kinase [Nodularia spumigena CS-1038]
MTKTLLNNRYQVIQVLGAGGFGETFLAEDTHMPSRRRCVIKQLKPIANDPKTDEMIQQRFEREAATLEYLGDSCNQIPKLYAYFSENGLFYLVQEWIEGPTLTNIVEAKGPESETAVREILLSLLSVLDYVHSKGIIHRDIKPDNIILRSTDNKPFLIDFGAVKETIRSVVSSSHHPTRSLVIGTPGYMPTEQAIGRPVYATDIYSLGLTAIYLLTGKHPPELQTHLQTGAILWEESAPDVSRHLAKVINQAIHPHVSDRYSTASKMLYALKSPTDISPQPSTTKATVSLSPAHAASTQQTQAISSSPTIPSRKSPKSALIIGSLVLGGLIGGVAISSVTRQPQSQESITTSSTPTPFSDSDNISPTPSPTASPSEPTDTPVEVQPRLDTVVPVEQQPQVTPTFAPEPDISTAEAPQPETPERPPQPETPEPPPQPETPEPPPQPETPEPPPQQNQEAAPSNTKTNSVPAFPTGTSQDAVKAALGKPSKNTKGLWNTRAYLYKLEDNVDLGYLFDQKTGILRQTEIAFAPSVPPEVMQRTLQGMLGGNANSDITQGLQKVRDRQTRRYSFNVGGLKGVIERNQQDRIYIGVWDADLHN